MKRAGMVANPTWATEFHLITARGARDNSDYKPKKSVAVIQVHSIYNRGDVNHAVVIHVDNAVGFRLQHLVTQTQFAELVFMDSFKVPDLKTKPFQI